MKNIFSFLNVGPGPRVCLFHPCAIRIGRIPVYIFITWDKGTCHPSYYIYCYYRDGYRQARSYMYIYIYAYRYTYMGTYIIYLYEYRGSCRLWLCQSIGNRTRTSLHTHMHTLVCALKRFFNRFAYPTYAQEYLQ